MRGTRGSLIPDSIFGHRSGESNFQTTKPGGIKRQYRHATGPSRIFPGNFLKRQGPRKRDPRGRGKTSLRFPRPVAWPKTGIGGMRRRRPRTPPDGQRWRRAPRSCSRSHPRSPPDSCPALRLATSLQVFACRPAPNTRDHSSITISAGLALACRSLNAAFSSRCCAARRNAGLSCMACTGSGVPSPTWACTMRLIGSPSMWASS
jgi:hypothetical protein